MSPKPPAEAPGKRPVAGAVPASPARWRRAGRRSPDILPSPPEQVARPSQQAPEIEWQLPEVLIGQDAVWAGLQNLLAFVESEEHLDLLLAKNAERIAKLTGNRAAQWRNDVRMKRDSVKLS